MLVSSSNFGLLWQTTRTSCCYLRNYALENRRYVHGSRSFLKRNHIWTFQFEMFASSRSFDIGIEWFKHEIITSIDLLSRYWIPYSGDYSRSSLMWNFYSSFWYGCFFLGHCLTLKMSRLVWCLVHIPLTVLIN